MMSRLLFSALFFGIFSISAQPSDSRLISVQKGSSSWETVTLLRNQRLIGHRVPYLLYLKWTHNEKKLQAGTFLIPPRTSYYQLTRILTGKEPGSNLFKVTIPEGFSIQEIGDRLEAAHLCRSRDFVQYAKTRAKKEFQDQFPFLSVIPILSVEGYLFPDTYFFSKTDSVKNLFVPFFEGFQSRIYDEWRRQPRGIMSLHETLTLASIVEKEARVKSDQPLISGVFYNRLNRHQPLESCPTVVYALGRYYQPSVSYRDLLTPSPYNTYRNPGLPPGPISNPGLEAFRATLYPKKSNYFYFFATGKGTHIFSTTYREHLDQQRAQ